MTEVKENPERIWAAAAKHGYGEWQDVTDGLPRPVEYVRADLYDALAKERDELQAEVKRLRREIDDTKSFCKGISINIEKFLRPATQRGG